MASARLATARLALANATRSPLAWILGAILLLRVVGLGWGLPASDGWDVDGVAPRDVLAGLVETVTPGKFYVYPPIHLLLLGVLTSPVTIVALVRAPSLAPVDVVREIIQVPYMTAIAAAARCVAVAMSLGVVWAVAKMAEEIRGERAGWCAAAFVGVNVPLTYYAHTSNLDVPSIFWASLALLALVRAVARHEPRRLRAWGLLAALAVGTKDQAYALYLFGVPAGLVLWLAMDPWARKNLVPVARELGVGMGAAMVVLLIGDGVIFNPSGFRQRVRFLLGPASQAYVEYTDDWSGRWRVLGDLVSHFVLFYPAILAAFIGVGLAAVAVGARTQRPRFVAGSLPLLMALSFSFAFNCAARRSDQRFELPQTVLLAVYGGVGLDVVVFALRSTSARWIARAVAAASFGVALFGAADVDANLVFDPRYDAEAWLRANVQPDDTVETYGQNVYMPRFPSWSRVTRVGPEEQDHRNPMPGVGEVLAPYDAADSRKPRFIVVSEGWAWRYLIDTTESVAPGRVLAPTQVATSTDAAATTYFRALTSGHYAGYRLVHASTWTSSLWPALSIHASTSRDIWIYERDREPPP